MSIPRCTVLNNYCKNLVAYAILCCVPSLAAAQVVITEVMYHPESDLDAEEFFDGPSVGWYRRVFQEKNPGRHETLTDLEFLNEWGSVVEVGNRLVPTRGAVLLFGQGRYLRQVLPRPVVDYQWINASSQEWSPEHTTAERQRTVDILRDKHAIDLT